MTIVAPSFAAGAVTGAIVSPASDHAGTFGSVTDNGDGTYGTTFKTGTAATHVLSATVNNIPGTGTASVVASSVNAIDATKSTIAVNNAAPVLGTDTVTATVQAKDVSSVNITVGGATVVFGNTGGTSAGTWSATTDVGNGTYTAIFTPTVAGTATTVTATINGSAVTGGTAPTITVAAGGYATPNILNNASFETGWDGFTNGAGGSPDGSVIRSTDRAKNGSYSLKFAWNHNAGDQSARVFYDAGVGLTNVWARCWFYIDTAWPNGAGYKFFRWWNDGYSQIVGIQTLNGNLTFIPSWATGGQTAYVYLTALPATGAWHSLEFQVDYTNTQLRFWLDDTQLGPGTIYYDPDGACSWSGQVLTCTKIVQPRHLDINRLINPTTNAGAAYFDRVAVSTAGRIGP